jgi:predicted NBD/HSP70 family sugar kinase
MLSGTNLKHTRAHNVRTVLEAIRLYGPISRADVARQTDMTAQTVSNIVRDLLDQELIREAGRVQEGRGAPSTTIVINPDGLFSIGLDIDQEHLTGVLVDLEGTVRQRAYFELDEPSPREAIERMVEAATSLLAAQRLDRRRIAGIGVGIPGPLGLAEDRRAVTTVSPKTFPGWRDVPVVDELQRRTGIPVVLENNATAAAIGESRFGAGRLVHSFFYVFFGSGLGGGLIVEGHPYEGFSGNAGELGYFPSSDASASLPLAQRPHEGAFFNLRRLYRQLAEQGERVRRPEELGPLLDRRHPVLMDWLETGARHLAPMVLAIEYLLDPEAVFFGGRLPGRLIDEILRQVDDLLPTQRMDGKAHVPRLERAAAGEDAAALGVATLPLHEAFTPITARLIKRGLDPVH